MADETKSGVTAQIRVRRCYGCGAILQDQYPEEKGYIPPEKFLSEEETLCQRCYKLRHYSVYKEAPSLNNEYLTILNSAKENDNLIVYVINAFTINGSIIEGISEHLSENVIAVLNKRDVVSNLKDEYLLNRTEKILAENNIKVKDIIILSSLESDNEKVSALSEKIEKFRNGKSVYFIGVNQVGKSSLVNLILKNFVNKTDKMITTSPFPGTTLDVISIPLDQNSFIYDTPGIENPSSIISIIEPTLARFILPRENVKAKKESLKPGQSLVVSNFLKIDLLEGKKLNLTYYLSRYLPVKKVNLTKADSYMNELKESSSIITEKVQSYDDLSTTNLIAIPDKKNIIRVYGLGTFVFQGSDQKIEVKTFKGVKVLLEDE